MQERQRLAQARGAAGAIRRAATILVSTGWTPYPLAEGEHGRSAVQALCEATGCGRYLTADHSPACRAIRLRFAGFLLLIGELTDPRPVNGLIDEIEWWERSDADLIRDRLVSLLASAASDLETHIEDYLVILSPPRDRREAGI